MAPRIEDEDEALQDTVVIHNDVQLPDDVLDMLGEAPNPTPSDAGSIHSALAERWLHTITQGLAEEEKEKLIQKYKTPANCPLLIPPTINPETKSIIPQNIQRRTTRISNSRGIWVSA
nr:unnamed protein product [Callosobruchus analis]CAI5849796.1 unnamed protein product [Callosobruchus analis]